MKNYIVKVRIKSNDCEVGTAKIFVRDNNEQFASKAVLDFFSDKYQCEIIEIKEFNNEKL